MHVAYNVAFAFGIKLTRGTDVVFDSLNPAVTVLHKSVISVHTLLDALSIRGFLVRFLERFWPGF